MPKSKTRTKKKQKKLTNAKLEKQKQNKILMAKRKKAIESFREFAFKKLQAEFSKQEEE